MLIFRTLYLWLFLFPVAILNAQNTGISVEFTGKLPEGFNSGSIYQLSVSNDALKVIVSKVEPWSSFIYKLPKTLDLRLNPFVNLKLKGSKPFIMSLYLSDGTNNYLQQAKVHYTENRFSNFYFDFNDHGKVDLSSVKELFFAINGAATSFTGEIFLDDLLVGSEAKKIPNMMVINDLIVYKNSKKIKLTIIDLKNASTINISGGEKCIENINISQISDGSAVITFDCIQSITGQFNLNLIAKGNDGYSDNSQNVLLTIEDNQPPVMNAISNLELPVGQNVVIPINGIDDGNVSVEQVMSFEIKDNYENVISSPVIDFDGKSTNGKLKFKTLNEGTITITLKLKDDGTENNILSYSFDVQVFNYFNHPPDFSVENKEVFLENGKFENPVLKLTDGDDNLQGFVISAKSLNPEVISNPVEISFIEGNPQKPKLLCTPAGVGKAMVEVILVDVAPMTGNGNKSTVKTFEVDVKKMPVYGLIIDPLQFSADTAAKKYKIESSGIEQTITSEDFMGSPCLKIVCNEKGTWTGFWYRTPDLDLTDYPYISYEVYAVDKQIQTHTYFWDNYGARNGDGAHAERKTVQANIWTTVLMDFRQEGELLDGSANKINISRIDTLLFNYHKSFGWPFTNFSVTLYIRNIRVGNQVKDVPVLNTKATVNEIGKLFYFAGNGKQNITLTGITSGKGNDEIPIVKTSYTGDASISDISVNELNEKGEAILTFNVNNSTGKGTFTIDVSAKGADPAKITFEGEVTDKSATNLALINVDISNKNQIFRGFGAADPNLALINQFVEDAGGNHIRFFVEGDDIEPVNDNNDPFSMDKSKILKGGLRIDYINEIKKHGLENFFITVLSPPSWMKQNLSSAYFIPQAPDWASTDNKVDPGLYDEYVEFMMAIVRVIKEETGIELMGICPQNEPAFCEPYGSAILDPVHNATVCGMLGERLVREGFKTKVINSEQVFTQVHYSMNEYIKAVKANKLADQYTQVIGTHYPDNNDDTWKGLYNNCTEGTFPKELWATECRAEGNDWEKVMDNINIILTGLNNGLGLWTVLGWNRGALFSSDYNPVGDQIGIVYGNTPSRHFYALKGLFQFFRPGAINLSTTSSNNNLIVSSFIHNDHSTISLVIQNVSNSAVKAEIKGDLPSDFKAFRTSKFEQYMQVDPFSNGVLLLPPSSITYLQARTDVNHAPVINAINDIIINQNSGQSTVNLDGISDGDISVQDLEISYKISGDNVISNESINYKTPENSGTFNFNPVPNSQGTATVILTLKDNGGTDNGGKNETQVSFKIRVTNNTGMDENSDMIKLYPNPAENELNYILTKHGDKVQIQIYDLFGKQLIIKDIEGSKSGKLDLNKIQSGIYLVKLKGKDEVHLKKIIKK